MHKIKIVGWETPELAYGGPMVDYMAGKMNHGEMFKEGGTKGPGPISFLPQQDPEMMYTDRFNTSLTKKEQKEFSEWAAEESKRQGRDIMMDKGAYDVQGFWKSGDYKKTDENGHGSDKWKKPNHPTFSNQSNYHGVDGFYGGNWTEKSGYQPSKQSADMYGPSYYNRIFAEEPGRREHLDASRFMSGVNRPSPLYYKNGGQSGPGPKKPFFPVINFAEPKYVAGQNPEGHYGYSDNTIWYDPNSQIENVNNPWWMGHEQYHHYQTLTGKNPRERRGQEVNNEMNKMIQANPELQFIPRNRLIAGSKPDAKGRKPFVGAEDRIYEDPSTLEGEARAYEQYIDNGGKSIFPKPNLNSTNNYPIGSAPLRQGLNFKNGGLVKAKDGDEVKCKPGQIYLEGTGCIDIASKLYKELYESGKLVQQLPDGKVVFPTSKPFVVNSKLTEDQKRALLRKDMLETSLSNQNQAQFRQGYTQSPVNKILDIITHPGTAIRAYNKMGYVPSNLSAAAENMGGSSSIINTLSPFTWLKGAGNATKQFVSDPFQTTQDVLQGTGNLLAYGSHKLNESTLLPGQTMSEFKSPFGDAGTNARALNFVGNVADALPLLEFANLPGVRRFIKPSAPTDLGEAIIQNKTFSRYNPVTKADEFYNANVADRLVPTRSFEDVAHKMKNLKDDLKITPFQDFFYKRIPKLAPETSLEQGKGILFDPETGKLFDSNTRYWLNRQYGHTPSIESLLGPRGLKPISSSIGTTPKQSSLFGSSEMFTNPRQYFTKPSAGPTYTPNYQNITKASSQASDPLAETLSFGTYTPAPRVLDWKKIGQTAAGVGIGSGLISGASTLNKKKEGGVASNQGYYNVGMGVPRFDEGGEDCPCPEFNCQCPPGYGTATQADSLRLYQGALAQQNWFKNNPNYKIVKDPFSLDRKKILSELENTRQSNDRLKKSKEYYKNIDKNKFDQRELTVGFINKNIPIGVYDRRIQPNYLISAEGRNLSPSSNLWPDGVNKANQYITSDIVELPQYDPIYVAPWNTLKPKQQQERLKKYGPKGTPYDPALKPKLKEKPKVNVKPKSEPKLHLTPFVPATKIPIPQPTMNFQIQERKFPKLDIPMSGSYNETPSTNTSVGWNVEYFDPIAKKTQTKHFDNNEEAEAFYNNPANNVSSKYSDVSSYEKKAYGGDISIPQLPRQNSPLLQFYYNKFGGQAPRNLMDSMVKPQKKRKLD